MMTLLTLIQMTFISQIVCLATLHNRFLMVMMNLEMFGIMLLMTMLILMMKSYIEYMNILLILTLAAAEMAMGLALLVLMNRSNSSDLMMSMNSMKS